MFGGELIPEIRRSVLKRAISDFQRGPGWWTGKSDHRRRTCAVTGSNRLDFMTVMLCLILAIIGSERHCVSRSSVCPVSVLLAHILRMTCQYLMDKFQ